MTTPPTQPPLTAAELDAIEARALAATPGWHACTCGKCFYVFVESEEVVADFRGGKPEDATIPIGESERHANAAFAAAARLAVPRLVADLRAVTAECERQWAVAHKEECALYWSGGERCVSRDGSLRCLYPRPAILDAAATQRDGGEGWAK